VRRPTGRLTYFDEIISLFDEGQSQSHFKLGLTPLVPRRSHKTNCAGNFQLIAAGMPVFNDTDGFDHVQFAFVTARSGVKIDAA
jgi:hypothetical protein